MTPRCAVRGEETAMRYLRFFSFTATACCLATCALSLGSGTALAQQNRNPEASSVAAASALTYADLADLSLPADIVLRGQIRTIMRLKPAESPGLAPGFARVYVELKTQALLFGGDVGESVRFLADIPLDDRGRLPKLSRTQVIVPARRVAGKPGDLLLVAPDAMLPWSAATETQVRAILTERVQPEVPPRITALREALHVPGNLAGEGETQLFFATEAGKPVSLSVIRRPDSAPTWGVSFSEIVDQAAQPPQPNTLAWYRLACSLPATLPDSANISDSEENRAIAVEDYALVMHDLGPCLRSRPRP